MNQNHSQATFGDPQEVRICIKTSDGQRFEYRFTKEPGSRRMDLDVAYNVDHEAVFPMDSYSPVGYRINSADRTLTLKLKH